MQLCVRWGLLALCFDNVSSMVFLQVHTDQPEGEFARGLRELAESTADVSIGSYPATSRDASFNARITIEGLDASIVEATAAAVADMVDGHVQSDSSE